MAGAFLKVDGMSFDSEKVSVVIPIYNAERFLDQALSSVEKQTHRNLEIICVNDGSTDGSLDIIKAHAGCDDRYIVIDKQNEGYGASCNKGIEVAAGEWIAVFEPDDWIETGMYGDMLAFAGRECPDAVVDVIKTPYWVIRDPDSPQQAKLHCSYRGRIRPKKQPFRVADEPHLLGHHPSVWSAIYRKAFLDEFGIRFREIPGAGWADNPFLVETLCQARGIVYWPHEYYCYREETPDKTRAMAQSNPLLSFERWQDMADILDRIGEASPEVLTQQITRGFTNMATTLRYISLEDHPEVVSAMHAMFDRMEPSLVFADARVSPSAKRMFADYRGIKDAKISACQYWRNLASEAVYNVWNKGPKQTFRMIGGFLSR